MARSTVIFLLKSAGSAGPDADLLQNAVEHLAVVELDHVLAARDAELLQRIGHQHAGFGVGGDVVGADRIGIELHELAEAARAGLLVAEDVAVVIAAEGLGQFLEVLGDIAGQRRRQVIAQRQPFLVLVLEREDAGVGPVLVGQEFAQRIGKFEGRRIERLVTIGIVDAADGRQHLFQRADLAGGMSRMPRGTRASGRPSGRFEVLVS